MMQRSGILKKRVPPERIGQARKDRRHRTDRRWLLAPKRVEPGTRRRAADDAEAPVRRESREAENGSTAPSRARSTRPSSDHRRARERDDPPRARRGWNRRHGQDRRGDETRRETPDPPSPRPARSGQEDGKTEDHPDPGIHDREEVPVEPVARPGEERLQTVRIRSVERDVARHGRRACDQGTPGRERRGSLPPANEPVGCGEGSPREEDPPGKTYQRVRQASMEMVVRQVIPDAPGEVHVREIRAQHHGRPRPTVVTGDARPRERNSHQRMGQIVHDPGQAPPYGCRQAPYPGNAAQPPMSPPPSPGANRSQTRLPSRSPTGQGREARRRIEPGPAHRSATKRTATDPISRAADYHGGIPAAASRASPRRAMLEC